MKESPPKSFESSLARLEEILEKMNSDTIALDESVALYEEADTLINSCSSMLNEAEQKVEVLMKDRQGKLLLSEENKPQLQEFSSGNSDR